MGSRYIDLVVNFGIGKTVRTLVLRRMELTGGAKPFNPDPFHGFTEP